MEPLVNLRGLQSLVVHGANMAHLDCTVFTDCVVLFKLSFIGCQLLKVTNVGALPDCIRWLDMRDNALTNNTIQYFQSSCF